MQMDYIFPCLVRVRCWGRRAEVTEVSTCLAGKGLFWIVSMLLSAKPEGSSICCQFHNVSLKLLARLL